MGRPAPHLRCPGVRFAHEAGRLVNAYVRTGTRTRWEVIGRYCLDCRGFWPAESAPQGALPLRDLDNRDGNALVVSVPDVGELEELVDELVVDAEELVGAFEPDAAAPR